LLQNQVFYIILNLIKSKRYKDKTVFKKGVKILRARIGAESNKKSLLPLFPLKIEVESLLTDFKSVEKIPFSKNLDGYIIVEEASTTPSFEFSGEKAEFKAPFSRLIQDASDLRFSLWGNQGFLYRYTLYLLEKKHRILNLHACALYSENKNHLYLVIGGAGSGKTVYLLSGLAKGLKLFSTETVHFRIERNNIAWFMGSLVDNVRLDTLKNHFPQYIRNIDAQGAVDEWQKKIALDLSPYRTDFEELRTPDAVIILYPRIEEGRKGFLFYPIRDKKIAAKLLFDNITQKISETVILYDRIPVLGIDEKEMAVTRLEHANKVVSHETVKIIASVLSNPDECWGDLLR